MGVREAGDCQSKIAADMSNSVVETFFSYHLKSDLLSDRETMGFPWEALRHEWQTPSFGPEDEGLLLLPTEDELLEAVVESKMPQLAESENCGAETDASPAESTQEGMADGQKPSCGLGRIIQGHGSWEFLGPTR